MKTVQVYDPAMCCASGVCGPEVDPKLVQFAADLRALQENGVEVRRFNLAQNPAAFMECEPVRTALTEKGESALPMVFVGETVVASGAYPTREELSDALGLAGAAPSLFTPAVAELVAVGAAIAANCDPCLRYHVHEAEKLGVSPADLQRAVELAAKIKDAPHRAVLRLAGKLIQPPVVVTEAAGCCGEGGDAKSGGCGDGDAESSAGDGRCCG